MQNLLLLVLDRRVRESWREISDFRHVQDESDISDPFFSQTVGEYSLVPKERLVWKESNGSTLRLCVVPKESHDSTLIKEVTPKESHDCSFSLT